jgi:hypothetical protein
MSTDADDFKVIPFNILPVERNPDCTQADINKQKEFIRTRILPVENIDLLKDPEALDLLRELGSDLIINCFSVNFKLLDGAWNTDGHYPLPALGPREMLTKVQSWKPITS